MVLLTVSLVGQLTVQRCLCSGEVSVTLEPSHDCDACSAHEDDCEPCHHEHGEEPSPCENGDCYVVLFELPPMGTPAVLALRHSMPLALPAPSPESLVAAILPAPTPAAPAPAPPPDRSAVPLTVLYGCLLI